MCRIQVGCIYFAYGLIITGRSLCLSHFEERQMGHIQRQQSCYLTKSTKGIRLLIFVSTTLIAPFLIQNNKIIKEKKTLIGVDTVCIQQFLIQSEKFTPPYRIKYLSVIVNEIQNYTI